MTAFDSGEPPTIVNATAPASAMRRDILSAYVASASRIGSWVVVSALVYRFLGAPEFAMLALVRGTIGLLNYTSLGLAPALIHRAAQSAPVPVVSAQEPPGRTLLSYYTPTFSAPTLPQLSPVQMLYSNALVIAFIAGLAGVVLTVLYALGFDALYHIPGQLIEVMPAVVLMIGLGTVLRLVSDAPGAMLQVNGRIALDNLLLAGGDLVWAACAAVAVSLYGRGTDERLSLVAVWYAVSGGLVFLARIRFAARQTNVRGPRWSAIRGEVVKSLLTYGSLVVAAQLADYLYSPTDYILINRLLHPLDLANYAPAVQIDSGLLLLVTGLSAVLLPKAAIAHAGGSTRTVRLYYLRGTLASLGLLLAASLVVWLASPWLFRLWLGNPMPATQAILPLVLANTVIGGSSAVGRSILLAVGKAKPFTISVLIAGAINVLCSYAFVHYLHWGLAGIVLGTVVAVIGRCALWMPWYVLRVLNRQSIQNVHWKAA